MRDNPEGGESDHAEGVRRRCMKNSSSVLSCMGKRTTEGCNRGSEIGTVHSGRDREGPVPPRKPKESGRRGSCEKNFVPKKSSGCAKSLQRTEQAGWKHESGFGERVRQFITEKSSVTRNPLEA